MHFHYYLSLLFKIPVSTVSRHLISWVNFLYFKPCSIPIWPLKDEILETMPTSFKKTCPNARCTFDCTELYFRSPSSLNTQSCLYSSYKNHVTCKGLVGKLHLEQLYLSANCMTAHFMIKKIVNRSGFLIKTFSTEVDF